MSAAFGLLASRAGQFRVFESARVGSLAVALCAWVRCPLSYPIASSGLPSSALPLPPPPPPLPPLRAPLASSFTLLPPPFIYFHFFSLPGWIGSSHRRCRVKESVAAFCCACASFARQPSHLSSPLIAAQTMDSSLKKFLTEEDVFLPVPRPS